MFRIKRFDVPHQFRHAGNFFVFVSRDDYGYIVYGTRFFRVSSSFSSSGECFFVCVPVGSIPEGEYPVRCGRYVVFLLQNDRCVFVDLHTRFASTFV